MTASSPHVLSFGHPDARESARFGGKGARLAAMYQVGFPVPDGYVVDVAAFDGLIDEGVPGDIDAAAPVLQKMVEEHTLSPAVIAAVVACLKTLGPVAIRSSAVHEDGAVRAGAGQYTSVLGVTSGDDVERAVRTVLMSQFSAHSLRYWGAVPRRNMMALVVQRMLAAEVSGVIFTKDPVSGRSDVVVVEACRGLGTSVVDGDGVEERLTIDRSSYDIVERTNLRARVSWSFDAKVGAVVRADPVGTVPAAVLSTAQRIVLTETAFAIEDFFGTAVDVEWSFVEGRLMILQARPITTGWGRGDE